MKRHVLSIKALDSGKEELKKLAAEKKSTVSKLVGLAVLKWFGIKI